MGALDDDADESRQPLLVRALALSYFSVAFGLVAGASALAAGLLAGSLGVLGLGLNVLADVAGSIGLVWRFGVERRDPKRGLLAEARASIVVSYRPGTGGNHPDGCSHQRPSLALGARALFVRNDLSGGLRRRAGPPRMGETSNGKTSWQPCLDGRRDIERHWSRPRGTGPSGTVGRATPRVVVGGSDYRVMRCARCLARGSESIADAPGLSVTLCPPAPDQRPGRPPPRTSVSRHGRRYALWASAGSQRWIERWKDDAGPEAPVQP